MRDDSGAIRRRNAGIFKSESAAAVQGDALCAHRIGERNRHAAGDACGGLNPKAFRIFGSKAALKTAKDPRGNVEPTT